MPECCEIAIAAAMSHAAITIAPGPGTLEGLVEACSLIGQPAKREMRHLNICCAQQCFS
jgi:anthranilate/para-aminobenzoate synthase component II